TNYEYSFAVYGLDDTGPFQPILQRGLTSGTNTIFTCPAGKTVTTLAFPPGFGIGSGTLRTSNNTGGLIIAYSPIINVGGVQVHIGTASSIANQASNASSLIDVF